MPTAQPAATTPRPLGDIPSALPVASQQDGSYPRPQLMREAWANLDGTWSFRHDDANVGLQSNWGSGFPDARDIVVPFPPESPASGIHEPGFHPVVWYARTISADDVRRAGRSAGAAGMLLHFGAVDYRASVWLDGQLLGSHEGGHTPFTFDVSQLVADDRDHLLVVRAEDDPGDVSQPRGKQDWHEHPHVIWYERTTGIWQIVWLEAVPTVAIEALRWLPATPTSVSVTVRFRGKPAAGSRVHVALRSDRLNELLAELDVTLTAPKADADLTIPLQRQRNGQGADELFWSPESPHLIDAVVTLVDHDGAPVDAVSSYLGLRTVAVGRGAFLLNDRPYHVRSVLNQAYWPQSHLAAPSYDAHRREVELIKELGFNSARLHQKIEDPRFLYWADRLGLLVWGEVPGAYEFSPQAIQRLMREWMDAVERDISHPSIVTWVPANESWGIQNVAHDPAQQAYSRALADVTRALDPTRPVISNDGWEHTRSDIITIHDYEGDGETLARTYADAAARQALLRGMGPAGRSILVGDATDVGQPVMLTEFGGVDYQPEGRREDGWGYTAASDGEDWLARITALYDGIRASAFLAGSCYTQLTDTAQETNGLLTADRQPKVAIERLRKAIAGH